jgi:hypothetical protein
LIVRSLHKLLDRMLSRRLVESTSIALLDILKRGLLGLHSGGAIRESGTVVPRIVSLGKVPDKLTSTVLDLGPKLVGGRGSMY